MQGRKTKPLDAHALMEYALRSLSARAQSTGELRTKLNRKAAAPADVDSVLVKLGEAGFLDDARFADAYASARRDNQGFGKMRVLRDLRTRRVSGPLAAKAAASAFEGVNEEQMIDQFLKRKYRGKDLPAFLAEEKNLAAAFRRLRVAGFSSSAAIGVLKRYAERAGELEEEEPEPEA